MGCRLWNGTEPRLNPNWATIEFRTAAGESWYNSLQVSFQKRLSHGLQFQTSYTWAHCLDNTQGVIGGEAIGRQGYRESPCFRVVFDKGNCDYDIRHTFVFNTMYNLPNPIASGWGHTALGGWRLGTILTLKTGQPFTVYDSGNSSLSKVGTYTGLNTDRPDVVPGCDPVSGPNNPKQFYNPACFRPQAFGTLGNEGRNQYTAPGLENWDFSLTKDTPLHWLGEAGAVQFRAELFNVTNHPNLFLPNTTVFSYTNSTTGRTVGVAPTIAPSGTAGQITLTSNSQRELQFALKLIF